MTAIPAVTFLTAQEVAEILDVSPCVACGTLLLPASLRKHKRLSCPPREQVAS